MVCGNFILPEACKPCLFLSYFQFAQLKLSVEERKARNHRLCKRGGFMESLVPELIAMPDEDAKSFLRLALTSEPAQEFLKKRAGDGNAE